MTIYPKIPDPSECVSDTTYLPSGESGWHCDLSQYDCLDRSRSDQLGWDPKAGWGGHMYFGNLTPLTDRRRQFPSHNQQYNEACQEFRGQVVPQIEAVHNLRKVRM